MERWGLGPHVHLGIVLENVVLAGSDASNTEALQHALDALSRAVDKYQPCLLHVSAEDLVRVLGGWKLPTYLDHAVRYLASGKWVAAHLMIETELMNRKMASGE